MDTGFIGLGTMGRAMAANLLKAGHHVRVWNRSQEPVQALVGQGATACESPTEAFQAGVVISMLADDDAIQEVLQDDVLARAPQSAIHVNMATISVALAKELTQVHAERGLRYVAAPVFGRPDVAEAAKLNIVAAGEPSAIEHVAPLFEAMGQRTWHLGQEPYRANVVKLAGNFMLGCAIEAMAEACAMAQAHDVAPADVLEMLTNSLFSSPVYKGYGSLISFIGESSCQNESELAETISDPDLKTSMVEYRTIAIPASAIARAIAFAIEEPSKVDVNEIVARPTAQPA